MITEQLQLQPLLQNEGWASPHMPMLKPYPPCDDICWWGPLEVIRSRGGALVNGLSALTKETPERAPPPLPPRVGGHSEKMLPVDPAVGPSQTPRSWTSQLRNCE